MIKKNIRALQGYCKNCHHPNTSFDWCHPCNSQRFRDNFSKWTSGSTRVNDIIKKMQTNATNSQGILEWIPWSRFRNVLLIDSGGAGSVYSANWIDGYIAYWDDEKNDWGRYESNSTFAIKVFRDSKNITASFLNEILAVHQYNISGLVRYYGFTKEPNTDNYGIVLEYAERDLRQHIGAPLDLGPSNKLEILIDVSLTLNELHSLGLVHKNLHTQNILSKRNSTFVISDFGLCFRANKDLESKEYFGMLEYSAPEILLGSKHTKESDIYSLGIIMLEVFFGMIKLPGITSDISLAKQICHNDIRPEIPSKLPAPIISLIQRCWDKVPERRPKSHEIYESLSGWWMKILNKDFPSLADFQAQGSSTTKSSKGYKSKRLNYYYYLESKSRIFIAVITRQLFMIT